MQKLIIIASLLALSACTLGKTPTEVTPKAPDTPTTDTSTSTTTPVTNAMISLHYVLHEGSADGKVIDTSREDVAKKAGLYASGRTYSPFEVVLGTKSVVPGFEAGIATMKKGEKKSFVVEPKDGYGEARVTQTIQKYQVAPEFTLTVDKKDLQDTVTQMVQKSQLGEAGKDLKEGQSLTGGYDLVAKVMKIDGENITLEIENKNNPYYGKKLAVGATAEQNGATYTISALSDTGVTLAVKNSKSPFAGKKFEVGAVGTLPDNLGGSGAEIKVLSLS
jgi:FKBP-type peptidyl-prolyl cis-trans isomerase 2